MLLYKMFTTSSGRVWLYACHVWEGVHHGTRGLRDTYVGRLGLFPCVDQLGADSEYLVNVSYVEEALQEQPGHHYGFFGGQV